MDIRQGKKVKDEVRTDEGDGGACGWSEDMTSEFTRSAHAVRDWLRGAVVKMANEASLTPSLAICATSRHTGSDQRAEVGSRRDGALHPVVVSAVKTRDRPICFFQGRYRYQLLVVKEANN